MAPRHALLLVALLIPPVTATCIYGVNPDQGRFICTTHEDCGPGYECRPQASGGGLCYARGACGDEACDALDNDCDGVVDEDFRFETDNAHCGRCGNVCGAGSTCRASTCAEQLCADGRDNDGDGVTDCADPDCAGQSCADLWLNCSAPAPPGVDAGTPARGTCVAREQECANGVDDDADHSPDCADPDCNAKTCSTGKACTAGVCPR